MDNVADVFLSYKRSDRARVETLAKALGEEEISVWFDAKLEPGYDGGFDAEIERELASAAAVIACWSPAAVGSMYVHAEAKKALELKKLMPIFVQRCELRVPFNGVDTVDLSAWTGDKSSADWMRLLSAVKKKIDEKKLNRDARQQEAARALAALPIPLYPGSLATIVPKLERYRNNSETGPRGDWSCDAYHNDFVAVIHFISELCDQENVDLTDWHDRAERHYGSSTEWGWEANIETGAYGQERRDQIHSLRIALQRLDATLDQLGSLYRRRASDRSGERK